MKLFHQLSEIDQNNALNHCTNIVVQDMIDNEIKLEPVSVDDQALKNKLEAAIKYAQKFNTDAEKIDYLFSDAEVSKAIFEIALEMAKSAYYHSSDELVIFPEDLATGDNKEDLPLLPEVKKPKKSSILN